MAQIDREAKQQPETDESAELRNRFAELFNPDLDGFEVDYIIETPENDELREQILSFLHQLKNHEPSPDAPDSLKVIMLAPDLDDKFVYTGDGTPPADRVAPEDTSPAYIFTEQGQRRFKIDEIAFRPVKVRLFSTPDGFAFQSGNTEFHVDIPDVDNHPYWAPLRRAVDARNARKGWFQEETPTPPGTRTPIVKPCGNLLDRLPQPTFIEARVMATAISDGRDKRGWSAVEGTLALLHTPRDNRGRNVGLQTRLEPGQQLLGWWGNDSTHHLSHLENDLQSMGLDAVLTFVVCLSGSLEHMELDVSLDDIIAAIGKDTDARRSAEARYEWRCKVWRWLLLFDSMTVIGARRGTWKEPRNNDQKRKKIEAETLYSRDALLKIVGQRGTEQTALDTSAPPKEVVIVAGPWARQWRGNREILSDFGTLKAIAGIPRGKPAGAWAACIGLVLQQKWRERASRASLERKSHWEKQEAGDKAQTKEVTLKFEPFTRRDLLLNTLRSDHDVLKILESDKPGRAKTYWEAAVKLLQQNGVIGDYKELAPLKKKGYDWQKDWLDQPLDIRPAANMLEDAITINKAALASKRRYRSRKLSSGMP